jgi:hypothetical protein
MIMMMMPMTTMTMMIITDVNNFFTILKLGTLLLFDNMKILKQQSHVLRIKYVAKLEFYIYSIYENVLTTISIIFDITAHKSFG